MARPNFFIVAENTAPAYVITCTRDGTAINLTSATVKLILQQKATGTITNTGHQTCTVVTATSGVISYTATAADFPSAGNYIADIEVTYNGGGVERLYNQGRWKVRSKLA